MTRRLVMSSAPLSMLQPGESTAQRYNSRAAISGAGQSVAAMLEQESASSRDPGSD